MQVADHPMSWNAFEGVIGGGYGAGTVIVWDRGTYRNLNDVSMREALDRGHASFWLNGEKLRGGWSLRRTDEGAKPKWLLIKKRDDEADARRNPVGAQPESAVSGRTIEQVAEEG